ncbi:hypothetical protein B5M09_014006 [Aphanomyces astaci]|uniref:Uncharacterized protein n=1 Tax=Aphanomyces astaci TaxID=112090 RepID=A0A3R7Y1V5_APHAT|nr:hypothetical protein B5M09_014006 [Aphanomyces astaci]
MAQVFGSYPSGIWSGPPKELLRMPVNTAEYQEQVTNPAELLAAQLKNKLPELVQQKCQGVSHDTITEIVFESLRHICSQIDSAQTIKGGGGSVFLAQDKTTTAEDNQGTRSTPQALETQGTQMAKTSFSQLKTPHVTLGTLRNTGKAIQRMTPP